MQAFTSILVDVDAAAAAQPALDRAARVARACGARLRVVDVISAPAEARRNLRADVEDELMTRRRQQLARIGYGVRDLPVDTDILAGPPADALIRDVLRFGHGLVVRSHARDLVTRGPAPFRAVDIHLFRQCPCPVWAVGPGAPPQYPRIVGAVDASAEDPVKRRLNRKIIEVALLLTHLQEGSLILLQAWRPFAEKRVLSHSTDEEFSAYLNSTRSRIKQDLARLVESFDDHLAGVQLELRRGDVEEVLPAFAVAEGIDVVVMGTMGRTGIARRLVGNTAERVLRRLPCSIVAVKPDDFVSAVHLNGST
jgi:nucleotide-binding universal stress UspA family protein